MNTTKRFILGLCLCVGIIGLLFAWYTLKRNELQNNLNTSHLPLQNILAKTQGVSLDGQSLVFYHIRHLDWPDFHIRRAQIKNSPGNFSLQLRGVQANLLDYFKHQPSSQFKHDLQNYNPQKNLLDNPLLSLAILGYDNICFDISINVRQNAPNQISIDLIALEQGSVKLHLNGKTTAPNDTDHVIHMINNKNISYHILHIDPKWKELLDTYTLSKNLPFLTEYIPYTLSLSKNRQ